MICVLWFVAYCLTVIFLFKIGWIFTAGFVCGAGWLFWQRVVARVLEIYIEKEERKNGT